MRKILTPPSLPDEVIVRELEIPSSQEWLGVFNFLLLQATYVWYWEQLYDTDLDPETCAATCYDIYVKYLSTGAASMVDVPYWDDASDVDDQAPVDDQPWYGKVEDASTPPDELTFIEDATIWVFTGLLAVATVEVGFAPAIAFRTIAPKFVVAIRQGNLGRIIRLFVDGAEAARVDDDGSDTIIELPVIGDPENETHQIYITSGAA